MRLKEYKDFESKEKWFESRHTIDSLERLDLFLDSLDNLNIQPNIFRGISSAKYKLFNSAQRIWITQELVPMKDFTK